MCTWLIEKVELSGSGKGTGGWFPLERAQVYYDHPFHAPLDHALNIDFVNESLGSRVAIELTAESARALVHAIQQTLQAAETHHGLEPALSLPKYAGSAAGGAPGTSRGPL